MLTVNVPIVSVPVIQSQLGVPPVYSQFIVTTYALMWGALLLVSGRAADLAGRRRPLIAGLLLLIVGTCLSIGAPIAAVLITGRALQGAGAALASTAALSLLVTVLPEGPQRRQAFALVGLMTALGSVLGLVFGGALTFLTGWRSIFLPSLVLAITLALAAVRMVPMDARPFSWREFDLPGALTAAAGVGLLVFAISQAERAGVESIVGCVAAVGLLVVFLVIERRSEMPLLPLTIVKRRNIVSSLVATVLIWSGFASLFFHMSFLLQQLLHYTPLQSALAYLPLTAATALSARIAAIDALSRRLGLVMLVGGASIALGSAALSLVEAESRYAWPVLPCVLLAGTGLGLSVVSIQIMMFRNVPASTTGVVSGLLTTAQETASAVGTTALATLAVSIGGIMGLRSALLWGAVAALIGGALGAMLAAGTARQFGVS